MQGFFWFFLGGLVYLIYHSLNSFFYKVKFINETKIHSIKLIGYAYEQLVFSMTAKYISLEQSDISKEKIKLFKNADEAAFEQWKKEVVGGLQQALPIYYHEALEIENWDDVMNILDSHYKKALRSQPLQEENEHAKIKTKSTP
mgnify:CR=1 FL=1